VNRIILLDVGNVAAKAVLVESARFTKRWRFDTAGDPGEAIERLVEAGPEGLAYSSVVPAWTGALRSIRKRELIGKIVEAGPSSGLPFGMSVEEPMGVGPDRLCAAAGAWAEGSEEAVIVDAGTAVTVDLLSGGYFRGGSIFPGLSLLAGALHGGTALLPLIGDLPGAIEPPGRSTADAMMAGITWGLVGAVKELVSRTLPEGADLWVTGGGGEFLAPYLGHTVRLERDLVLKGLLSFMGDS
jgi:type III pantothenate kinase